MLDVLLFLTLAAAIVATSFFAPVLSPLSALGTLLRPGEPPMASISCALALLGAAVVLAAAVLAALSRTRAQATRTTAARPDAGRDA